MVDDVINFNIKFLSTPSARRATTTTSTSKRPREISIHALCEEGDPNQGRRDAKGENFYPRPLRGGRRQKLFYIASEEEISIHALCEEGDLMAHARRRRSG